MKNRRKGFTLAELLIVIAVIGVLVAISIPIINKQLEKAREAHDIATMRQAAAAAMHLYYEGITEKNAQTVYQLKWWNYGKGKEEETNVTGVYDPSTGTFYSDRPTAVSKGLKPYGKGTKIDGKTNFFTANERGAYASKEDYTKAVVLVSIFPLAAQPHVDIYWKVLETGSTYIGGNDKPNIPNYSMRLNFN